MNVCAIVNYRRCQRRALLNILYAGGVEGITRCGVAYEQCRAYMTLTWNEGGILLLPNKAPLSDDKGALSHFVILQA